MGAWSTDPFGNDDALDWAWTLTDGDPAVVLSTLRDADTEIALESEQASVLVAAAAALARLAGAGEGVTGMLPEEIEDWALTTETQVDAEDAAHAVALLAAVAGDGSELAELWDLARAEDREAWRASIASLSGFLTPLAVA